MSTMSNDEMFWVAFSVCSGVGPKKFSSLLEHFGSAKNAWDAKEKEIQESVGPALADKIESFRQTFSPERYLQKLLEQNVWVVTIQDTEYPELLLQIDNPPFVLFGKGDKSILNNGMKLIGVVGTRKVTSYGRQVTEMMTTELVTNGCTIVSGLALGVDAIAHQTTLDQNGKTIAVLGCGVDCCYPSTNQKIYHDILNNGGAVISEFPLSMQPSVGSFPSRNRIIAGMSRATLVTEGAEDSGSLITAHNALKYGRNVFAVPGPITSKLSTGPMKLIREGGFLITSAEELLENIGIRGLKKYAEKIIKGDTPEEQSVIDSLQNEALHFDELVKKVGKDASSLGSLVSLMEVKGYITKGADGKIDLAR